MSVLAAGIVDDDQEWEYEHDENETEDFYITLDLTTHVPPTFATYEKRSRANKTSRGSNKSLANAPGNPRAPALVQQSAASVEDETAITATTTATPPPTLLSADRLQLIDLDTCDPLLSYNNTLYSCQWATDVATSLYLTPPAADRHDDPDHPPLRSTPSFSILGTGCARLIATPATIKPRTSTSTTTAKTSTSKSQPGTEQHSLGDNTQSPTTFSTAEGDIVHQTHNAGFTINLPSTASATRVHQAHFLQRLSAIKAQRGDQDVVPVTNIKLYKHPEGWEEERDAWIARETALSGKDRLEAELRIMGSRGKQSQQSQQNQQNQRQASSAPPLPLAVSAATDDTPHHDSRRNKEEEEEDERAGHAMPLPSEKPTPTNETDIEAEPEPAETETPQPPRKRQARGGPRGGAPSGKKLRQSLGLPEARRHERVPTATATTATGTGAQRPTGRPRQIRLDSEMMLAPGGLDEGSGPSTRPDLPAAAASGSDPQQANQNANTPREEELEDK